MEEVPPSYPANGPSHLFVQRGYKHRFKFKLQPLKTVSVPAKCIPDKKGVLHLRTAQGKELMSVEHFAFMDEGYDALTFADWFVYSRDQERNDWNFPVYGEAEAQLMKAVATYEFELIIDNSGP